MFDAPRSVVLDDMILYHHGYRSRTESRLHAQEPETMEEQLYITGRVRWERNQLAEAAGI